MKKYSLIYILLVTLFFTSCNDFLKETNYSGLSDEPFYDSEVGIEALVNSCYTPSRLWYGKEGGTSMTELGTDLFLKGGDCKHPQYSLSSNPQLSSSASFLRLNVLSSLN